LLSGSVESRFSSHDLQFPGAKGFQPGARVYVPCGLSSDRAWPVAVLLHGYAQALASERALAAWRAEYNVLEAYTSLERARVQATPALGSERTQEIQSELSSTPFSGMVLVTPITPIPYFQRNLGHTLTAYSEWIHQSLLPKVAEIAPISTAPEHVGLAGVSMGGLVGLELMWRFPEKFGAYCGIQIAIKRAQVYNYAWLLQKAFNDIDHGHGRPIRVVTATRDVYRSSNQLFYKALLRHKLDVSLELSTGAHTSRWMRQAGTIESLLWLDRILNRPNQAGSNTP
jgi:pimeloyl-ACP methyl ester carboxylesterase